MNRKSKIVLTVLLFLIAGGMIYFYLRQQGPETDFDNMVKDYEQRMDRLTDERDSFYRALATREQQYRHIIDSLNAAIIKIQTIQTQNHIQYENRRDSIILLPDHELYRMVTSYIERYNNLANSGRDLESHPE